MNRLVILALLVLALAGILLLPADAYACSCAGEPPPCDAFSGADVIFIGKVIGAAQQREVTNEDGSKTRYDVGSIRFAVQEAFVGIEGGEVVIHSGTGGGDCGYWFRRGEVYLVYAYGELSDLSTNICTRTRLIAKAEEDLAFLRNLPQKGIGGRVYGWVREIKVDPAKESFRDWSALAGITVVVEGKQKYVAATDKEGYYEILGVEPGEYRARALLPEYYAKQWVERKLLVSDRGCAGASFYAASNGTIAGRVIDREGNPVEKANVDLLLADVDRSANRSKSYETNWTDKEGRFKFENVGAGRYLIGVNLTRSPNSEAPYPPSYYPGVTDRAQATTITLRLGEQLSGYDIPLPAKLGERSVQGIVIWPDGSPVAGAEVYLTDHNHPGRIANGTVKTDGEGKFSIKGYEGLTYWIQASASKRPEAKWKEREPMHAEPPTVTLTQDVIGVKLVLTSEGGICGHYYKKDIEKR